MGAERWIVFLVLASLGGGIYIMSYLVDEESIERYGQRVAEYNAQHHETMMDAALHRAKRMPEVSAGKGQSVESKDDHGNEQVNDAEVVDRPYSENDRVMRARVNDSEDPGSGRAKRSHDQNTKEEKPDQESARARRSSGQGINEEAPDHRYQETARARRSSGQGINEEVPDHPYQETARARRSSGQGINEEAPDHPYQETARARRSSGQGINEEVPEHPYQETARPRRSSRPGMNEGSSMLDTKIENQNHFNPPLNADLFESSEYNDAHEETVPLIHNEVLTNADISQNEFENSEFLWKLEYSSEEADDSEPKASHINPYETLYGAAESGNPDDLADVSRRLLKSDGDKTLITFNKGIDFILKLMNAMFSLEGKDSVPLPGLNKTFGHGIMKGTFEASQGAFKNPATLHRTGDVAIVKNGDSVGLEVALGLQTLDAGYDHYDLKILKIHQNGSVDVSIAENSIKMKISLTYFPHCNVDVNYLELDQLGGIKVDITGLGAFQSMFDMLSKWLLDNFTNDFRNIVNKKLIEKAKKAVAREDICKYFPLNLL